MDPLAADQVRKVNNKIHAFVIHDHSRPDPEDVDLYVVQPPPTVRNQAHHRPVVSIQHLCDACRGALEYFSFWRHAFASEGGKLADKLPPACPVHSGAEGLRAGEGASCHLCVVLMANLRVKRIAMHSVGLSNIEMCWQSRDATPSRLHFAVTHQGHPRSSANYWNLVKLDLQSVEKFDLKLLGDLQRHSNTGSPLSRHNARQWLARCQANQDGIHDQCNRQPSGDWLPTRLLDVTSAMATSTLKLATPRDDPDPFVSDRQYVTLSHCWGIWGGTDLPVLTTANLVQRMEQGIAMELLPLTFRHAVQVAHWFNVRWLWIDSLCILQDSKQDWQQEAPMMYDVYKNALLNISADDSPDARWGCFREREPVAVLPMHLEFAGSDGGPFFLLPHQSAVFSSVTDAPLAKRGWVFQERQLSRRVLHFTSHELVWECCAEAPYFASETFPGGSPFPTAFNGKPKFQSQTDLRNPTGLPELYATWDLLYREYSTKHFTHKLDKLVALSGLAQEFATAFADDQYVAGMWRSTLPESLLWESGSSSRPFRTKEDEYIAPSWSWASIDGIADPISTLANDRLRYPLVDILDVATDPAIPSHPTGLLRSASISLACFLRPIELRPDYEKKPWTMMAMRSGGKAHRLIFKNSRDQQTASMDGFFSKTFAYSLDVETDTDSGPASVSGYFLPLCISTQEKNSPVLLSGLIVEAVGGRSETFRRVGILYVYGQHCHKVKYEAKGAVGDWSDGEIWQELARLLKRTHESFQSIKEDEDMKRYYERHSGLGHGDSENDTGRAGAANEDCERIGQEGEDDSPDILEELDKLEIGDRGSDKGKQKEVTKAGVDLGLVKPLDRLYALDVAVEGSQVEGRLERLSPRPITLISRQADYIHAENATVQVVFDCFRSVMILAKGELQCLQLDRRLYTLFHDTFRGPNALWARDSLT